MAKSHIQQGKSKISEETKKIKIAIVEQIKAFLDEYLDDNFKQGRKRKNVGMEFWKVRSAVKKGRRKILSQALASLKIGCK
jgi:hypothetical protein